MLNPQGHTVMSGTYTGYLTAVLAASGRQREIAKPGFYEHIHALAGRLSKGITEAFRATGIPGIVHGIGARFGLYLGVTEPVTNYRQVFCTDRELGKCFLRGCLARVSTSMITVMPCIMVLLRSILRILTRR